MPSKENQQAEQSASPVEQPLFSEAFKREVLDEMTAEELVRFADRHGIKVRVSIQYSDDSLPNAPLLCLIVSLLNSSSHQDYARLITNDDPIWKKLGAYANSEWWLVNQSFSHEEISELDSRTSKSEILNSFLDRQKKRLLKFSERYGALQIKTLDFINQRNDELSWIEHLNKLEVATIGRQLTEYSLFFGPVPEMYFATNFYFKTVRLHEELPDWIASLWGYLDKHSKKFKRVFSSLQFDDSLQALILKVARGGGPQEFYSELEQRVDDQARSMENDLRVLEKGLDKIIHGISEPPSSVGPYRSPGRNE